MLRRAASALGRTAAAAAAIALVTGCSRSAEPVMPPPGPMIQADLTPDVSAAGPTIDRARSIAAYIERKYLLVDVWDVRVVGGGEVASFAMRMRLGERSDHPEFNDWHAHVKGAARDVRQATVEALQLAARYLPKLRLASVWQDQMLTPFWSREQILEMGDPAGYRDFETFQDLVVSAEVLPLRPS